MKEKHLDINKNPIRVGDVVIIRKMHTTGFKETEELSEVFFLIKYWCDAFIGSLAEVTGFGCVEVKILNPNTNKIMEWSFDCTDVEVIGNVR